MSINKFLALGLISAVSPTRISDCCRAAQHNCHRLCSFFGFQREIIAPFPRNATEAQHIRDVALEREDALLLAQRPLNPPTRPAISARPVDPSPLTPEEEQYVRGVVLPRLGYRESDIESTMSKLNLENIRKAIEEAREDEQFMAEVCERLGISEAQLKHMGPVITRKIIGGVRRQIDQERSRPDGFQNQRPAVRPPEVPNYLPTIRASEQFIGKPGWRASPTLLQRLEDAELSEEERVAKIQQILNDDRVSAAEKLRLTEQRQPMPPKLEQANNPDLSPEKRLKAIRALDLIHFHVIHETSMTRSPNFSLETLGFWTDAPKTGLACLFFHDNDCSDLHRLVPLCDVATMAAFGLNVTLPPELGTEAWAPYIVTLQDRVEKGAVVRQILGLPEETNLPTQEILVEKVEPANILERAEYIWEVRCGDVGFYLSNWRLIGMVLGALGYDVVNNTPIQDWTGSNRITRGKEDIEYGYRCYNAIFGPKSLDPRLVGKGRARITCAKPIECEGWWTEAFLEATGKDIVREWTRELEHPGLKASRLELYREMQANLASSSTAASSSAAASSSTQPARSSSE